MQKAIRAILAIFSRVLLIGMTIQIGFGMFWMVANLGSLQEFEKTSFCALIGEGIFLVLWQVMQVLVAFFAIFRMLRIFLDKHVGWLIWGSLAVITIPMAMQCHLAVLPYSLTSSMLLLELGSVMKYLRTTEKLTAHTLLGIVPFGLIASLLMPEYALFSGIPIVVVFLQSVGRLWRENRKQIVTNMWFVLAFVGIFFAIQSLPQRNVDKQQDAIWNAVVSRVTWATLCEDYFVLWSEEMRMVIDYDILLGGALYADGVEERLIPDIRNAAGENADEFLKQMVTLAWDEHSRDILKQMMWDSAGYTLSPTIHHMLLQRRGYDSFSGRNYDIMLQNTPFLTKHYVNYSCWWFGVAMLLATGILLLNILRLRPVKWLKVNGLMLFTIILSAGAMVICYTMQGAGMFDYKKSISIASFWGVWMVIMAIGNIEEKTYETTGERKTA